MKLRQRAAFPGLALACAVGLILASAGQAFAEASVHGGRYAGPNVNLNGNYALINGNFFQPNAGSCVLFSIVAFDPTDTRQLETGLVKCLSTSIDGSCASGTQFIETLRVGTDGKDEYDCTPEGSFAVGSTYGFTIERSSNTNHTFTATTDSGGVVKWGGFQSPITMDTWGEWTDGSESLPGCNGWWGTGHFSSWEKKNGTTWDTALGNPFSEESCWTVGNVDSGGDYEVSQ